MKYPQKNNYMHVLQYLKPICNIHTWASTSPSSHYMNFCSQNAILASIIFVQLNVGSIEGFCDPYVSIAFEEEKSHVCFVNVIYMLWFEWLQSNLIFVIPMQMLQMSCVFQWKINTKNASIASFVLVAFCVYWNIVESFFCICVVEINTLRYCITKHGYKKWFWYNMWNVILINAKSFMENAKMESIIININVSKNV